MCALRYSHPPTHPQSEGDNKNTHCMLEETGSDSLSFDTHIALTIYKLKSIDCSNFEDCRCHFVV